MTWIGVRASKTCKEIGSADQKFANNLQCKIADVLSQGAEIKFKATADDGEELELTVFTTRPDTIFGATYMVLAPEHQHLKRLTREGQKTQLEAYVEQAAKKSDLERTDLQKDKTGIFTGSN